MDSNRGPSAYQPNALPLGQTGSRGTRAMLQLSLQPWTYICLQPILDTSNCQAQILASPNKPRLELSICTRFSRLPALIPLKRCSRRARPMLRHLQ